jgi:squalene cyclase
VQPIKNTRRLTIALALLTAMQNRRNVLEAKMKALRRSVLNYYQRNNRTQFIDEEGNTWKKQQGSTVIYDDAGFKKLLQKRGVPIEDVYKQVTIEERDEESIRKLLSSKKIRVKEWKRYAIIHYHEAYIRAYPTNKKNETESG